MQHSWFFQIDRKTSEQLLLQECNPNGSFLVRPSLTYQMDHFILSRSSEIKHYLIRKVSSTPSSSSVSFDSMEYYFFLRPDEKFFSIEEMIAYYQNHCQDSFRLTRAPCRANFIWQKSSIANDNVSHHQMISWFQNRSKSYASDSTLSSNSISRTNRFRSDCRTIAKSKLTSTKIGSIRSENFLKDKSWSIKSSELQLMEELGSGQFSVVRHGILKGKIHVAVKLMKGGRMSEEAFIEEAKIMNQLDHPNLVKLFGICTEHRPICIVVEYMKHGSLLSFLQKNKQRILESSQMIRFILNLAIQIADAMCYLESKNFVHRDLAARNCLVGSQNIVKVADFGLTRYIVDDEYQSTSRSKFPIRWAPPEF
ncbi:tyrosine-protein kinase-like protein 1 [Sarcoptes scabiei]|uniref:Tyrosine-protein kinase n=1 Tax=Sarcoptes scabiei TaxID=52283 RepID=A0A131ZX44_SARSC|nr:tyrosine-protein kinase-like protein 1 [Sarcoptes scabiei]